MSSMWVQTLHIIRFAVSVISLCCLVSHLNLDDVNVQSLSILFYFNLKFVFFNNSLVCNFLCSTWYTFVPVVPCTMPHIFIIVLCTVHWYWYLQYPYNFGFSLFLPSIICNPLENFFFFSTM